MKQKLMELCVMMLVLAVVFPAVLAGAQGPIGPLPPAPPSPQTVMVWTEKVLQTSASNFTYTLRNWVQAGWQELSRTTLPNGAVMFTIGKFIIKTLNAVPIYIPNQQQIQPSWRRRVA